MKTPHPGSKPSTIFRLFPHPRLRITLASLCVSQPGAGWGCLQQDSGSLQTWEAFGKVGKHEVSHQMIKEPAQRPVSSWGEIITISAGAQRPQQTS